MNLCLVLPESTREHLDWIKNNPFPFFLIYFFLPFPKKSPTILAFTTLSPAN